MKPFIIPAKQKPQIRKQVLDGMGYGRKAARTGNDLASAYGYSDDRYIRVMIRELIGEGVPIASAVSPPLGFFIAQNEYEAAEYIRVLKARIWEDEDRLRDFLKACTEFSLPEQLALV